VNFSYLVDGDRRLRLLERLEINLLVELEIKLGRNMKAMRLAFNENILVGKRRSRD
jgi:hypothetical protein